MALGFPIGRMGAPAEGNSVAFGWPGGGRKLRRPRAGGRLRADETRLVLNFDTALSVTTVLADYLAGTR